MLTAVVGINWGDEGKGRMVDLLAEKNDVVVRYQGGNNAGHTVINPLGEFKLNLMPSGIFRESVVNILGLGMVIDIAHLNGEIKKLTEAGVKIGPENLKISDKATICMPYHVLQDGLEEARLADKKYGSTKRGIAPVYSDKYAKKTIRMGDLLFPDVLEEKVRDIVEWKNLLIEKGYGEKKVDYKEILSWLQTNGAPLLAHICDTGAFLEDAANKGKNILFEAQLGALRDIDYGIFPYTSSSSTIASYAPIGSGIPGKKLDLSVGIMKAYSTCVGEGPFTVEMFGEEAETLRKAGGEYGAATGRPRRVGGFDVVASKYGVRVQGADQIALTKLDILSCMEKIPVCTAYEVYGELTTEFPVGKRLADAKPIIEYLDGWNCDISGCRKYEELPINAQKYVEFIAKKVGCNIKYISVGASRDEYIEL